jgi:putative ABC transport system permease protein
VSSRTASWRALLRIARRDALRARGRSALVVAMVALPVLALAFVDVLLRSAEPSTDQQVTWRLGAAQAELWSDTGGPVQQSPDGNWGSSTGEAEDRPALDAEEVTALLPPGTPVVTWSGRSVRVVTVGGTGRVEWVETALADPVFAGRYTMTQGRAPRERGEVAVTPRLLRRVDARVGDRIDLVEPPGTYEVVGVVTEEPAPLLQAVFASPGTLPPGPGSAGTLRVFVGGDDPLRWDEVVALNERGVWAYSRAVVLDPPPEDAVPLCADGGCSTGDSATQVAFAVGIALVVVLAALEVALLAGAAFAVGARRQARALGLLTAIGGDARHVRRVVLAGGVVLGVTGGLAGVALGTLGAVAAIPLLERYGFSVFPGVDVRPAELLAIAALGAGTGVLAAVLPARGAARQDPLAALQGRRGTVRTPRKVPAVAVVVTAVGVTLSVVGSALAVRDHTDAAAGSRPAATSVAAGLVAGGAALTLLGLIVLSPAIVGLAGRFGRFLPLAPRLALRDAARHRGRSAPAVAAVLAAVTGSVALLLYVAALDDHDRRQYSPALPVGHAGVPLDQSIFGPEDDVDAPRRYDPVAVERALRGTLPVESTSVVAAAGADCRDGECGRYAHPVLPPERACPLWSLQRAPTPGEERAAADDPRCIEGEGSLVSGQVVVSGTPVGGAELLPVLTGGTSAEAEAALAAGGVVVADPRMVLGGKVRVEVTEVSEVAQEPPTADQPSVVELPGAALTDVPAPQQAIWSPAAARRLGLAVRDAAVVAQLTRLPTQAEEDAAAAALGAAGVHPEQLLVERGYVSDYGLGLLALAGAAAVVTVGAVGIATGLAQADARPDHATLAAVGAAPRLRRTLAACQALSIAGIGVLLGVAAGLVPGVAFVAAMPSYELVVPWRHLALVVVGLPLLAAAGAWLGTRSRLPMDRRVA